MELGMSYPVVLSYTRRMMQNILAFRDSPAIRRSPVVVVEVAAGRRPNSLHFRFFPSSFLLVPLPILHCRERLGEFPAALP